jgi:hypothetical protein
VPPTQKALWLLMNACSICGIKKLEDGLSSYMGNSARSADVHLGP